ncbi:MAG: isopentenyl-diphosphate delta-isomerase [Saprospiraceae bacterium]
MSHQEPISEDPLAEQRKMDHIDLAFKARIPAGLIDARFRYEPMLQGHPDAATLVPFHFLDTEFRVPFWASSMTGGTGKAGIINKNLAQACREFGFGMGLGSCRQLLHSDQHFEDFNLRPIIGADLPLFANLGIAQVQELQARGEAHRIISLIDKLKANGLILHINPLQEWLQEEGDRYYMSPIETVQWLLSELNYPIIVKEVGQGMGPQSLRALLALPIAAIDFAAHGGTNFSQVEMLRKTSDEAHPFESIARIGHDANEMVQFVNEILADPRAQINCRQIIISGGIQNFLDAYYLLEKLQMPAVVGMASGFLKYAQGDYAALQQFVADQINGLALAKKMLTVV